MQSCSERFHGQPWQTRVGQVRAAMRGEGWVYVLVRHNSGTGGLGSRRIDDLCPKHAERAAEWNPKTSRRGV